MALGDIASPAAEGWGYDAVHETGLPGGFGRKRTKSRHGKDRPLALTTEPWRLSGEQRTLCECIRIGGVALS